MSAPSTTPGKGMAPGAWGARGCSAQWGAQMKRKGIGVGRGEAAWLAACLQSMRGLGRMGRS